MKIKILNILILLFIFVFLFQTIVLASNPFDQIESHIQSPDTQTVSQMNSFRNKIYTVFQLVGTGLAVIGLIVLGIKYVYSAPNERADVKKYAIIYVVGAVLFFGAIGIVELLKGFGLELFK